MTTISDIVFEKSIPISTRVALLEYANKQEYIHSETLIIKPTVTNDDVSGSQRDGNDFTYEDASFYDFNEMIIPVGYYEYFRSLGNGNYTGHSYEGDGSYISAIVIYPPAYAIDEYI